MKFNYKLLAITASFFLLSEQELTAQEKHLPIQKIQEKAFSVIPRPMKILKKNEGKVFLFNANTTLIAKAELKNEAQHLQDIIDQAFSKSSPSGANTISLKIDHTLEKEAYKLSITEKKITIHGGDAAGVFYGIQTLKQMMPVHLAFGTIKKKSLGAEIVTATIEDKPLAKWRGVMVDSARHFQPKTFIKKFIDLMAIHKLNRMHWHLVDSEGWRLEIKKYPKLTEVCQDFPAEYPSEDPENKTRPARYKYGHFHGGGFYTQEDVREIVAYAKERHVEIMPEIEFPGHAMAMFTAYPEFSVTGKKPTVRSNISPDLININEKSLNFLRDILDETMALFPFEMIHFGGDEAPKGQWKKSAYIQERMKELSLKDEEQLQAWLFNEMAQHIAKKGRRPAGWEEIMHGENMEHLTKKAVIMPWLSRKNGIKSANHGYGVIHTGVGPFYLDSWQTKSPADNWALYKGPLTMAGIYNYNLFPKGLSKEGKQNIWGAQCQLWSELMPKTRHMEYQAYPRLTALAELTWTQQEKKNYQHYYKRLLFHTKRLDALKVNYRFVDPLPLTTWNQQANKNQMSVKIPFKELSEEKQKVVIELRSKNNKALNVSKVEVVNNGKVISLDEHIGTTDSNGLNNAYTVSLPAKASAKQLTLKVHYQANPGSKGEIRIFKGRGRELFNPRNFAGGDYPTLSWKKSEITSKQHRLRIPMDGLIKKAGDYELIIELTQNSSPVTVNNLHIAGSEGTVSKSSSNGKLKKSGDLLILPITINNTAVKPGNSIFLTLKSNNSSGGDIRVRAITEWPKTISNQWSWKPELLHGSNTAVYTQGVTASKNGQVELSFQYTGGANGLDIFSVQLVKNGKVICEDKHKGFTGGRPKNNHYFLKSAKIKAGEVYQIRLSVNGAGGNNSHGVMMVK